MKLRTWCGSIIETNDYTWRIWHRWAFGWFRNALSFFTEWTEWRGSLDGRPVMYIKRLLWFPIGYSFKRRKVLGCRIDLHKIIRRDDDGCFHSHPAYAVRVILRGGYTETVGYVPRIYGEFRKLWLPFDMGVVAPSYVHRISCLINGPSYSLWFRGPIVADVKLIGDGWPADKLGTHPERN